MKFSNLNERITLDINKLKPIARGVSKKHIKKIQAELRKQGYSGFKSIKYSDKYYNIYYTKFKKIRR